MKPSRRKFLTALGGTGAAALAGAAVGPPAWGGSTLADALAGFFQDHYQRMTPEEIQGALARIERRAKERYGVAIRCRNTPPLPGVVFGYALNISKCKGYRECVYGCIQENNQGRGSQLQYIRVLEMDRGGMDLHSSDHYYDHHTVPAEGKFYLPVQCMQCDDPPCVKACPTRATWREPDGIVVIDYDWCIGCRYCMAACPYWARHFNWTTPQIPPEAINPETHYLGNRPRPRGVVEKCHLCVQRVRRERQPACMAACPTGARIFGNLLDPASEIRYVLENKTVFRLKEELGTEPKFWYFTDR
uniref:Prokaryotic molybdopterin-containing oxidoreductase family, iron-sulfur binding subunit n=1 Tax=Candidatus Kentrum sp. FM TaxID=2126340 RepID=A0A450T250_9GAMM|nr:MAG: prokaryotic molybdopterin-containing oxidoreductase family, iron-sulfur binding subunit [Candidatus Kentron sp. FM]VFJ60580.1 MAG: prokaryotic molybdopterin-containing oxidoreductase family, iron-sulfur binding subunit [Candidatus Kentron sp. FM]VFK13797.1 MAG: prokaryotic molybdopterin-containing oxidoreductase family, iron-sulfur binding subunit [Candidatus Kentron sp. FM]